MLIISSAQSRGNHGEVGCLSSLQSCSLAAYPLWMLPVSASPAWEKLHICTAQSHGMGVSTAWTSSGKYTPNQNDRRSWLGGPAHSTAATFWLKNISVCDGRRSALSCIHLFFCRFPLALHTNIPPPGRSTGAVQGGHLILKRHAPPLDVVPSFFTYGGWPPYQWAPCPVPNRVPPAPHRPCGTPSFRLGAAW